jgi:benzodiazapine receptor
LAIWIILIEGISALISFAMQGELTIWYPTIQHSPLTPPGFVFALAWPLLYLMIGVAGWLFWHCRHQPFGNQRIAFYGIQLALNWMWTPFFFNFHLIGVAFFSIIAILLFTALILCLAWRNCRLGAYLLLPYLAWLLFAGYLNGYSWLMN